MLGKLSVPGHPTNLNNSRDKSLLRLQQVRVRVVWTFFSLLYLSSFSLSLGDSPK